MTAKGELQHLKSVSCPSGIKAHKGDTFKCTVVGTKGEKGEYTMTELDSSGKVEITSFTPSS